MRSVSLETGVRTTTLSVVENKRVADGRVVQRQVLYLGEINSSQEQAWRKILVVYRLLSPGSEWRLHREWYGRSALSDLLGTEEVIDEHALYGCHDLLLEHETALFDHLVSRWRDLFNISFDVLLYDLTSTYFEIDPPLSDEGKRQFGYSRDHRSDKAQRIWLMDRGIPTEAVLEQMRTSDPPVRVKLLAKDQELYVFAESRDRIAKERSMRRRQLKWLWQRLKQLGTTKLTRESLLMKLGAAQSKAPAAWRLVGVELAVEGTSFGFWLSRKKLREVRRREGRYLLRTNLTESDPAKLWEYYLRWVAVEEAFKTLKGDLAIRRSTINANGASRPISSSPSSRTVCM